MKHRYSQIFVLLLYILYSLSHNIYLTLFVMQVYCISLSHSIGTSIYYLNSHIWYHRTFRLLSSHLFPYLEGTLCILHKVLSMCQAYRCTTFLYETFPHTQILSLLSLVILLFWTLSLISLDIWLSHPFDPWSCDPWTLTHPSWVRLSHLHFLVLTQHLIILHISLTWTYS